eukprot:NODE_3695_length_742_cov_87.738817_g3103_i0.p3 GENE.NODE_3695_length_742_cov_87.738817_g3103_i0~~NODE_3695_length_742_cov_87.738817_g3103_i0.p3  ORF type:complete len:90 (+),score=37.58 NODE_3695_length_742_cov_87.738817_g3103_i0:97-366(+)
MQRKEREARELLEQKEALLKRQAAEIERRRSVEKEAEVLAESNGSPEGSPDGGMHKDVVTSMLQQLGDEPEEIQRVLAERARGSSMRLE